MTDMLLILAIVLLLAIVVLQVVLLLRRTTVDLSPLQQALQATDKAGERSERAVREEIGRNRTEAATAAQQSRQEMATGLKDVGDSLVKQLTAMLQSVDQRLGAMRETIEKRLGVIQEERRQEARSGSAGIDRGRPKGKGGSHRRSQSLQRIRCQDDQRFRQLAANAVRRGHGAVEGPVRCLDFTAAVRMAAEYQELRRRMFPHDGLHMSPTTLQAK